MIVGVCGYGYTGSGAVLDILEEYETLEVIDNFELEIVYKPDGIETLEHFLINAPSRYSGSDTSIRRFLRFCNRTKDYYDPENHGKKFMELSNKYIDDLTQVYWYGSCLFHGVECDKLTKLLKYDFIKKWGRRAQKYLKLKNADRICDIKMYLSIQPENFYFISRQYLLNVIGLKRKETQKTLVLDQPYSADNPYKSFSFFEDPCAIVVDKDPRDMYLLAKIQLGAKASFIPSDNVDYFITYYRSIMSYRDRCKRSCSNVLYLHFEDLIYDADNTRALIEKFLGINSISKTRVIFEKEKSINNTQLFLKYPHYKSEIRRIEHELAPWLYDFTRFKLKPDFKQKSY